MSAAKQSHGLWLQADSCTVRVTGVLASEGAQAMIGPLIMLVQEHARAIAQFGADDGSGNGWAGVEIVDESNALT